MTESVGVSYVNTPEYRTRPNPDEVHIELMDGRGNMYESLNKQNVHSEEYDTIKRPGQLENEARRSTTGKMSLKLILYILVAVVVIISLLSIAGFAVVMKKVSSQSDRIDKIEANAMTNTANVQIRINKTDEQNVFPTVKGQGVAFTAIGINGSNPLIFPDIIYNNGNSYDSGSGIFTCTVPGIYYFASTLTKMYGYHIDVVDCYINVNSNIKVGTRQDPYNTEADINGYSMTLSGTFHLDADDTVYISCNHGSDDVLYNLLLCSFTGFLVTSDG